jgi:soluble lytic murein transglycosylase
MRRAVNHAARQPVQIASSFRYNFAWMPTHSGGGANRPRSAFEEGSGLLQSLLRAGVLLVAAVSAAHGETAASKRNTAPTPPVTAARPAASAKSASDKTGATIRAERLEKIRPAVGAIVRLPVADTPRPAENSPAARAFEAMEKAKWNEAAAAIARVRDPLLRKVIRWYRLTSRTSGAAFAEIDRFMRANPHWPLQLRLRYRAEAALAWGARDPDVLRFFAKIPPKTATGAGRLAEALRRAGKDAEAKALIHKTWATERYHGGEEARFLDKFGRELTKADHLARIHFLLFHHKRRAARRAYAAYGKLFDKGERALIRARLLFATPWRATQKAVTAALAAVPAKLRDHPGLVYDRVRWYRRHDEVEKAAALLKSAGGATQPKSVWWRERAWVARLALREGKPRLAYAVASAYDQTARRQVYEAEWLAGWIALRFLRHPYKARKHFERMNAQARWPISWARGAYWIGRATEALGNRKKAIVWYRKAGEYPSTFYGQFALARLGHRTLPLPKRVTVSAAARAAFERKELVRVARKLHAIGEDGLVRWFTLAVYQATKTPADRELAAKLATDLQSLDSAVRIAKHATKHGELLVETGYPVIEVPVEIGPEPSLILALVRQESEFNHEAVSWAGARGLMQLMPRTARKTAGRAGLPYHLADLIKKPEYNLEVGTSHLKELLVEFDGSYPLALAAYNAGKHAAEMWLSVNGDPRGRGADRMIDWIEAIPYDETRNYVQRVLEAYQIYKARLGDTRLAAAKAPSAWRADTAQMALELEAQKKKLGCGSAAGSAKPKRGAKKANAKGC